jgi:glutathione-independent formaldehyde dehydrogenase
VVIVGDLNADRLAQARSFGCETVDVSQDATLEDQIAQILGRGEVDCAVDAVGLRGHRPRPPSAWRRPPRCSTSIMSINRAARKLGIPGLFVTVATRAPPTRDAKQGTMKVRLGLAGQ